MDEFSLPFEMYICLLRLTWDVNEAFLTKLINQQLIYWKSPKKWNGKFEKYGN